MKTSSGQIDFDVINNVVLRAHYLLSQMIAVANNRPDVSKGDPKVGGHAAASSSALHILGALHLVVKSGFDHIAIKPHASPADHSYNYLLDLFLHPDFSKLSLDEANQAMHNLRAFPQDGQPVFQSYHSALDPDNHNFLPSGTVGIPPVCAGYLAHAYRFAKRQGYEVPEAHFWSVIGDSEFREGSLFEAIPDFAEREIGNLTWIVDYNRQSLDGHRLFNYHTIKGTDNERIEATMKANGWEVIQVRHGQYRQTLFEHSGGEDFQRWIDIDLADYELQALLLVPNKEALYDFVKAQYKQLAKFLKHVSPAELHRALHDFGGHDLEALCKALWESKKNLKKPTLIIAHTIKGWSLKMAAAQGNHSALPEDDEIDVLRKKTGLSTSDRFARFDEKTPEGRFLKKRGDILYSQILEQNEIKHRNQQYFESQAKEFGEIPGSLDINLKLASYPHTQWMLGQMTAKLTRLANTSLDPAKLKKGERPLSDFEKAWKLPGELLVSMAPDVGTSTNLNPAMDGKIFSAMETQDYEEEMQVKDKKAPDLVPGEDVSDRFLRFEIAEGNVMSCMGSYGRLREILGVPILPLMTVYDFFIKRALDQYFYDLYWKSSFILIGTPAGVTLSPEGAQHGWKSDFQIPNQITWEPFYCLELDWIICDAIKRHLLNDNEGRSGVLIRGVTRGVEQKTLLQLLRTQARFKAEISPNQLLAHPEFPMNDGTDESQISPLADDQILHDLRQDVLEGGYYLIDYRGYAGYEPGDNVVHIFAMGSLGTEAIEASRKLLERGIYANVIMVTSPDLLLGNLGYQSDYYHLREKLGVNSKLYLSGNEMERADLLALSGRRIPIVSVHDGEPGLLDNLGSIVGVRQEALAVRKHSKCGRPTDVYRYHGIDVEGVMAACGRVLSETALESIKVSRQLAEQLPSAIAETSLENSNWTSSSRRNGN